MGAVRPWLLVSFVSLLAFAPACGDDTSPATPDQQVLSPDAGVDARSPDLAKPDGPVAHKPLALKIAHVNDSHSQLEPVTMSLTFKAGSGTEKANAQVGGMPRLVAKVKALRAAEKALLVLHGGDALQGSLYFTKYLGQADVELMNLLKPDAMTLGNHEFDKGSQVLADFIKKASFPVLGGNIDASKDAVLKDQIKPYSILSVEGEQVAVIGVTTPETPTISSPGKDLVFAEIKATVQKLVTELEAKGVNKIVLLSHQGYDLDLALAKAIEGVDVIVGGHSHTLLGDFSALGLTAAATYPQKVSTPSGKSVCVVQAWSSTRALGLLDVALDKEGLVTSCGGKASMLVGDLFTQQNPTTKKEEEVPAAKKQEFLTQIGATGGAFEVVSEDAAALAKLNTDYKPGIDALKKVVVADVADDLWHVRVPGMTHATAGVLASGSLIAPHIAEAFLWKGKQLSPAAELAIVNAGGARIDIPKGQLTVAQVYTLLPFGNTLFLLKLTGAEVKAQLEAAVGSATASGSTGGPFPYVAGIRYTADMTKPVGQQVTVVEVDKGGGSWAAIDTAKTYVVATVNFLAGGGDGYNVMKGAAAYRYDTGFIDAELFSDYASAKKTLAKPAAGTGVTFIPKP